ncbi:MAG: 50S ribosomal protein L17 [Desulfobacterales bacterium]
MRHQKAGVKLSRTSSHRDAMFRNMVTSLLKYDRIRTTDVKAKELKRWVDHIVTLAKRGDLHARRQAMAIVREKNVVHQLFENAQARFGSQAGGYARVVKIGRRPGDAAPISLVELVGESGKKHKKKKEPAAPAKPQAAGKPEVMGDASDASAKTETAPVSAAPAAEPASEESGAANAAEAALKPTETEK